MNAPSARLDRVICNRRSAWIAAAAAAVIASLTLSSSRADACSCAPPPPPAAARDSADAVFEGRAAGSPAPKSAGPGLSPMAVSISFTVVRAFKGVDAGSKVTVTTSGSSSMCGYSFAPGETYLVYAWRDEGGVLGTGLCSRTRKISEAAEDLAALKAAGGSGSGAAPTAPTAPTTSTASPGGTAPVGSASPAEPLPAGNTNALPGNSTPGSSSAMAPAGAGAPSGVSAEPAGAAPPSSGGCAACAVNASTSAGGGKMPELAVMVGLVALAAKIARRRR